MIEGILNEEIEGQNNEKRAARISRFRAPLNILQRSASFRQVLVARKENQNRARALGFTLLELIIVISIIIILIVVVVPTYQQHIQRAREATLRNNLFQMRQLLDYYASDKGKRPQSLDDLVSAGYMREIPVDPITGERDWTTTTAPDVNSAEGGSGIGDVRSAAPGTSSEGTPYSEW